jgi:hypothetical protein
MGLSGTLPNSIGNLAKLTAIGFGSNGNISGTIPSSIGELSELNFLAMDGNRLHGVIPPEIAKLHKLTFFWLGANQLTGIIPDLPFSQYNSSSMGTGAGCSLGLNHFVCPIPPGAVAHCLVQNCVPRASTCTGTSMLLPQDQCDAWKDFYDDSSGRGWLHCRETRTDPCLCEGYAGQHRVCSAGGTTVLQV